MYPGTEGYVIGFTGHLNLRHEGVDVVASA
jgi:hypothetical protein